MTPYAEKLLEKKREEELRKVESVSVESPLPKVRKDKPYVPFRLRAEAPKSTLPKIGRLGTLSNSSDEFFDLLQKYPAGSEEAFIVLRRFTHLTPREATP